MDSHNYFACQRKENGNYWQSGIILRIAARYVDEGGVAVARLRWYRCVDVLRTTLLRHRRAVFTSRHEARILLLAPRECVAHGLSSNGA